MITRRRTMTGLAAGTLLPALGVPAFGRTVSLYVVWQGLSPFDGLFTTRATSLPLPGFSPQSHIDQAGATKSRPCLVNLGSQLLIAYRAADNQGNQVVSDIIWGFYDGSSWSDGGSVPGVGTSWAPSAAPWLNNHAIMVWNGVGDDTRIWTATYNPAVKKTNFTSPWSSQTLTMMPGRVPITTGSAPAIASLGNKLLMVWRGVGENDSLYSAVSGDGVTWTKALQLPQAASTIAPAVTVFKGQVLLAFKGAKNDTGIFVAKYYDVPGIANGSWATRWNVPGIGTSHGPTLTTFNAKLFMSWKGAEDNNIWWSQSATGNPKDWSPQKSIDGGTSVGPTAMAF